MANDHNSKCRCTALYSEDKAKNSRVCDFSYLESVYATDLSEHQKFIFCKHFCEPSFRHGWLLTFRRAIISEADYFALKTLAERKFIELRDEENGFIAIGRPVWPELYHRDT